MFVVLKDGDLILNTSQIEFARWIGSKNLALVRLISGEEVWLNTRNDFDLIHKQITGVKSIEVSNHLKDTKEVKSYVTSRPKDRGKQPARNYHLPAQVPLPHVFESPKSWDGLGEYPLCITCILPQNHPCHNASNPIEEKPNVNQHEETPTR